MAVKRIYVEKKPGYDIEAGKMYKDLKGNLSILGLEKVRILVRYDVEDIKEEAFEAATTSIFSEPPVDFIYLNSFEFDKNDKIIAYEFLPGQYDQRADSASQCIQIITHGERLNIKAAKIIILTGKISDEEYNKIKDYIINPVESQEASLKEYNTLKAEYEIPQKVDTISGFIAMNDEELLAFMKDFGFAMSYEDLKFCQKYFRDTEKRDPTITEIKVIDTYWSDHCRHTTFLTTIDNVDFEEGKYSKIIKEVYNNYLETRKVVYKDRNKDITLMDIATLAMKELKRTGRLNDLDESDEINACSIRVDIDVDGKNEEWLVMFKNETHNHPTEIEPFGGAATCLGGAIRDPLSGRAYVYQAMRVTGSGDPRTKIKDTLPGKLPQRKITTTAAHGYSSYGNQIGLATGQVAEVYDEGYIAKRMEIGAVIAAAPKDNVVRKGPEPGDLIILLGGRTGRDGCGGATGSSKEHTEESLATCGAEVQKGNPPTERKIQRLFRNPKVSTLIKKCNDFGAGGVCVAIGELSEGLEIDLDMVPKKYQGLDGTELAISESQERMAVVVSKEDADKFIEYSNEENLEASIVAKVSDSGRLQMTWNGNVIVDVSREFLDTNGVKQNIEIEVVEPQRKEFSDNIVESVKGLENDLENAFLNNLSDINVCSQKGLIEMFDSTIGAGTVLMPFGGKYQTTPQEGMAALIPVLKGTTNTGTLMAYGYNPNLSKWSPFHGALYAVIESVSKIVALGGDFSKVRLTFQEYFEKLGKDKQKWSKPFSALLGAYHAQMKLGIPAIGGKDSMSGTFKDLDVPPTLVSFAVNTVDVNKVVSAEFKKPNSKVVLISLKKDNELIPDFDDLKNKYNKIFELVQLNKVLSASTVKWGGIAAAISKMCFGNRIGFKFNEISFNELFSLDLGAIVLEIEENSDLDKLFASIEYKVIGSTTNNTEIIVNGCTVDLDSLQNDWEEPLEKVFPTKTSIKEEKIENYSYNVKKPLKSKISIAKPRVFIPAFPGTNCEYDTKAAFEKAGAIADTFIFRNITSSLLEESVENMAKMIDNSQIVMIPGGFSAGDEPEGSGKFIAAVFKNPRIKEAVTNLLNNRDGLMLGICNGFQALIKLGLVPYGEIRDLDESCPTLTFNTIGRHASCMVNTKICSNLSPWLSKVNTGDIHSIAISHGEGRFVASKEMIEKLSNNGQIATQYVDFSGNATYDDRYNPNGSINAIEGITSPDGRVLGKMGHSERFSGNVFHNIPGEKDQKIFEAGVEYFK